jgi:hypothetical protein
MLTNGTYTRTELGPAGGVYPRFFIEPVQDELASAQQGRPIFRQEERVEIVIPGDPTKCPVHRVTDEHRNRWQQQYDAFKKGMETPVEGTPLEEWPALNRAQVAELRGIGILTVEQVAGLSDTATQRVMGLAGLRTRALAYLDDASAIALTEKLSAENDALQLEISTLKRQVEELGAITQRLNGELLSRQNAPHPLATDVPGASDPMQAALMQQTGNFARTAPESSLSEFVEQRRRPGRPRKEAALPHDVVSELA